LHILLRRHQIAFRQPDPQAVVMESDHYLFHIGMLRLVMMLSGGYRDAEHWPARDAARDD
jgi:hypothetical protein